MKFIRRVGDWGVAGEPSFLKSSRLDVAGAEYVNGGIFTFAGAGDEVVLEKDAVLDVLGHGDPCCIP